LNQHPAGGERPFLIPFLISWSPGRAQVKQKFLHHSGMAIAELLAEGDKE
jgi:hypothetical protein